MIRTTSWKLCSVISLALLFSGAISRTAIAYEDEYYDFPTGEHEGGGVRGKGIGCVALEADNPQPLIPKDTQALTVSDSPELLFDVPDLDQASTLEILLLDQNQQIVSRKEFQPGYQPGIVSMNLVDDTNNHILELDSLYSWYLVQECAGVDIPKVIAHGSFMRVELEKNLAQQLEDASAIEKVQLYQSANIWHEAIASLAQLKCDLTAKTITDQQRIEMDKIEDSSDLWSRSFDTYCANDLHAKSIVTY